MKIKELFEATPNNALDEFVKLVMRDCQPFLKLKTQPLYRGLSEARKQKILGGFAIKDDVRIDRKPRDSNPYLHNAMNRALKKKYGVPVRSESLFCAYSKAVAMAYSDDMPYLIFPIGETKLIWSPYIIDPFAELQEVWGSAENSTLLSWIEKITVENELHPRDDENDRRAVIEILFDEYGDELYADGSSKDAQNSKNEIMVLCDSYYAISSTKITIDELMDKLMIRV